MTIVVSITQSQIFAVLGQFLQSILPTACTVVRGETNRVPEPKGADFVVMWPILNERLSRNVDSYADISFIGFISNGSGGAGTRLTVTQMLQGSISVGLFLGANGILANTEITAEQSGTGGVGTYTVNNSQNLASTTLQAGSKNVMKPVKVTIQVDVHGPNSADNAQTITSLFQDDFGIQAFAGFNAGAFTIVPLYSDDPRQVPFMDEEQQSEERWIVQLVLQVNSAVEVPEQFAGAVSVGTTSVDAAYKV
jgi:hypothetical protein